MKLGGFVNMSCIQHLACRCGVERPLLASLLAAQANFLSTQAEYFLLKPQATALQEDYLWSQLADPFLSDEMHVATQWQLSLEKQRHDLRLI